MFDYDCMAIQRAAFLTPGLKGRWGLIMNWVGSPGGAKTARIEQVTRSIGLSNEVVLLGLREPADILGYGVPQDDGFMKYHASDFVKRANLADGASIYLDEFNYAPPSVQGAAQRMILEGIVGDTCLAESVRFVLSMNPIEEAMGAGGSDISMALANRIGTLKYIAPTVQDWSSWLLSDENEITEVGDIIALERDVLKRWPVPFVMARAAVTTFLQSHPSLFSRVPKPNTPAASGPWPSPRSWEMTTRALASAEVHGLDEDSKYAFAGAFVGEEPISEFQTWRDQNDLPNPADVLDGKIKFKHDPRRLDVSMAVFAACAALIAPEEADKRKERTVAFWEVISEAVETAPDLVVAPVTAVLKAKGRLGAVSKTAKRVMAKMHAMLMISPV